MFLEWCEGGSWLGAGCSVDKCNVDNFGALFLWFSYSLALNGLGCVLGVRENLLVALLKRFGKEEPKVESDVS